MGQKWDIAWWQVGQDGMSDFFRTRYNEKSKIYPIFAEWKIASCLLALMDMFDLALKEVWLISMKSRQVVCKKLDLHKDLSNLNYYIEKKIRGWVGQVKRDVIKQAAFSEWDNMGRRQVGRQVGQKKPKNVGRH